MFLVDKVIEKVKETNFKLEELSKVTNIEEERLKEILDLVSKPTLDELNLLAKELNVRISVKRSNSLTIKLASDFLKAYRKENNKTKVELAKELNVSERTIFRIENLEGNIKEKTILKIFELNKNKKVFKTKK